MNGAASDLGTTEAATPPLRRVFVIEDSEVDAELLEMRLRAHYAEIEEVRCVAEPEDLIEKIAEFDPDIVISDYHMPRFDLVATVTELRRRWPTLPLLVVSGLVGEEAAVQVLKAGANDFLPKSRSERLPLMIDRELAEAQLKRGAAKLQVEIEHQRVINQAIFDQVPVGLWVLSPQGTIDRTNRRGEEMMSGFGDFDTQGFAGVEGWWADGGRPVEAADWPGAQAIARRETVPPRLMRLRTTEGRDRFFSCGAAPLLADEGHTLGAVVTAMDMTAEAELHARLREARQRVRRLSVNQLELHEQQMARVSRELHDNLGQVLSLLKLHLASAARADLTPARRRTELAEALPLMDLALARLREVCSDLGPSELADFGLGSAIATLCGAAARASGVVVSASEVGAVRPLAAPVQVGLFRVAQQAVTNALRHAHADSVQVRLHWLIDAVELTVEDDGMGFDVDAPRAPSHQGLRSMRERMELLGGTLRVESRPGQGTTVWAREPNEEGAET